MKKRILTLLTIMSAVLFLASCDEFPMPGGDEVVLEETRFSLPADGGRVDVTFVPLASWSVSCAESFVTISPESGVKSDKEVTFSISVGRNPATAERVIKVLLTVGEQDIVLTITQAGTAEDPGLPDNPDNPEKPDDPPGPGPEDPNDPEDPEDPKTGYGGSNEDVLPGDDFTNTK